jgi:hypothetical protein
VARKTKAELDMGRRPDVEQALSERYHVAWSYTAQVNTSQFDQESGLHNQARFEAIDDKTVAEYAQAIERGDVFPAVIAYRKQARGKLQIIDGNHRLAAHIEAGTPIDVYEVARDTDRKVIAMMTFSFNTTHGRPTSEAERIHQAIYLVENGAGQEAAAAAVNLSPRVLKRALAKNAADKRAAEVGIRVTEWETLSATVRNRLTNISTDEGFKAAAGLAYVAKLDANEVFDLVALLNSSKSSTKQQAIVKSQREAMSERIQAAGAGLLTSADRNAATPKRRIGMVIGQTLALPDDDNAILAAYAVPEREEAAQRMTEAGERLLKLAGVLISAK